MSLRAAGLGHDLNDTTARVTILGLEATSLYLNFLHEREVDAGAERAIAARPHPETSEGRVIDRNSVRDVGILKTGRTRNRGVVVAGALAINRARSQIEEACYVTRCGNILIKAIGNARGDAGRRSIDGHSGGLDFNHLRHQPRFD